MDGTRESILQQSPQEMHFHSPLLRKSRKVAAEFFVGIEEADSTKLNFPVGGHRIVVEEDPDGFELYAWSLCDPGRELCAKIPGAAMANQ